MGTVNGLTAKETLLMEPGAVFDLWELWLRRQPGYKKE
jgi:hypothetical protein